MVRVKITIPLEGGIPLNLLLRSSDFRWARLDYVSDCNCQTPKLNYNLTSSFSTMQMQYDKVFQKKDYVHGRNLKNLTDWSAVIICLILDGFHTWNIGPET